MFITDCPQCGRRELAGFTQVQRTRTIDSQVVVDLRCRCGVVHPIRAGRGRFQHTLAA